MFAVKCSIPPPQGQLGRDSACRSLPMGDIMVYYSVSLGTRPFGRVWAHAYLCWSCPRRIQKECNYYYYFFFVYNILCRKSAQDTRI